MALIDIDEFEKMINNIEILEELLVANEDKSKDDNRETEHRVEQVAK